MFVSNIDEMDEMVKITAFDKLRLRPFYHKLRLRACSVDKTQRSIDKLRLVLSASSGCLLRSVLSTSSGCAASEGLRCSASPSNRGLSPPKPVPFALPVGAGRVSGVK